MQWLAMLTMLIDHIGIVFFPDEVGWRLVGRLAFPLYAYGIALGWGRTRSRKQYLLRLGLIFIAAQVPYSLVLHNGQLNVVGTFLAALLFIWMQEKLSRGAIRALLLLSVLIIVTIIPFEYGAYGILLVLIYKWSKTDIHMAFSHFALNLAVALILGWITQLVSIVSTVLVGFASRQLAFISKPPRWLWLSFYPAHLLLLGLVKLV